MSADSDLKKAVLDELGWEPSVNAAHIGVTANAGVVTLTGHVDSFAHKLGAEKAASRVRGVKALAEEMEVKLPWEIKRGDEAIAAAAIERLSWNSTVPNDVVQVKVAKGWVTLAGTVAWRFEKDAAEQDIRLMRGVVGPAMGVKASGGVRSLAAVRLLVAAGATRIGTSSGVQILREFREGASAASQTPGAY